MINTQVLQGEWNQLRGQIQKKWSQLTDDDLRLGNGNIDQVVGQIQRNTGETREAIERFLNELTSSGASAMSQAAESAGLFARRAAEQVREGYGRLSSQVGHGYDMSREVIRANPAQSVATAFGVGVLLGVVLGLALRSR